MAKSKHIYRVQDGEMQFILSSISDRLDKLEGLRGEDAVTIERSVRANVTKDVSGLSIAGAAQEILGLDVGTVEVDDEIDFTAWMDGQKGVTAGTDSIFLRAGAASKAVITSAGLSELEQANYHPNGIFMQTALSGTFRVTTRGSLVLQLRGSSAGSGLSTVTGGLRVRVWRGS